MGVVVLFYLLVGVVVHLVPISGCGSTSCAYLVGVVVPLVPNNHRFTVHKKIHTFKCK